jgi:hypothetical protein
MKTFILKLNRKFGNLLKFPQSEVRAIENLFHLKNKKVYNFVELERYN